jgi:hypothetical protein
LTIHENIAQDIEVFGLHMELLDQQVGALDQRMEVFEMSMEVLDNI